MAFLTDRSLATGVTLDDLIHIVNTSDLSQGNPAGSSYKAKISQVLENITDVYVTGGTYSNGTTTFRNNTGGTFNVSGFYTGATDTSVTGYTYSSNTFTIFENDGSSHSANIDIMTGLTINGNLKVTGNTNSGPTTASTLNLSTTPNTDTNIPINYLTRDSSTGESTLNLSTTPNTDTNIPINYLTRDSSTGEVKIKQIPGPTVYGLYAQTGNSVTISGTTGETTMIGTGIGGLTVPENGFSVGDSFNVVISGDIGSRNGDTLTLRVKSGSVVFGTVGPISMPNVTNSHFSFIITFTIRSLGTAGNASIISSGYFTFTQNASSNFSGGNFSTLNNTTFDTTISNTLNITGQFNSTHPNNFIFTELLVLNKIY